jgi:hypothetical protein
MGSVSFGTVLIGQNVRSALTDGADDDKGEDIDADTITETISREEHVSVLNLSVGQKLSWISSKGTLTRLSHGKSV